LNFYSCVLYAASRYRECVEKGREAIRLLERTGDYWQVHIARYQVAAALYHLGDQRSAIEESRNNHSSGLELGDEQASGIILDVWARAARGKLPAEIVSREMARKRQDAQGRTQVLLADGIRHLYANRLGLATELLEAAVGVAAQAGIYNAYTLPSLAWLATAYRRQVEETPIYSPRQKRRLWRKARKAARRAIRSAKFCRNDLPRALREAALLEAMRGRSRAARRLFRQSLLVAEQQEARQEYAETLWHCGRAGRDAGWPTGEFHLFAGEQLLLPFSDQTETDDNAPAPPGNESTLSLADRFDTVLQTGRQIASALSRRRIYEEAQVAALRLLRGEDCLLIEIDRSGGRHAERACYFDRSGEWQAERAGHVDRPPGAEGHHDPRNDRADPAPTDGEERHDGRGIVTRVVIGPAGARYSEQMLLRSMETERAVAFVEEISPDSLQHESSERSALCVPIHVRGRVAACLYVTHGQVRGLFREDEERLAEFVAAIAGAALENAEGFQELERLNATLEHRVAERTAAAEARAGELARSNLELERTASELRTAEEQLREAKEAAEAANAAKSRFLATMSHEIRTPMNGILGMTEVALRTALSAHQRNCLNVVRKSGDALLNLLNDILDLSKIEAGKMELELIPFDLHEVVGAAASLMGVSATQKDIQLICRLSPAVPRQLIGDPCRIRQVIVNLLGNAIKFTDQGKVQIDVSVDQVGDQNLLHVAVQDTGPGIPPEKQSFLFESFRQTDSSTTRKYGGTGLGLSISSQLVELMQGRMWVESAVGSGSTFHFTIPLRTAPPAADSAGQPGATGSLAGTGEDALADADTSRVGPLHILLAEDGPVNQEVAQALFELMGHTCEVAETGRKAISAFERGSFDVIFMDLEMPEIDGFEATRRIREIEHARGTHTPIIAMTAHAFKGYREQCLAAGMDDYLAKPIRPEILSRMFQQILASRDEPVLAG
jgi:two-component system sensor kinase